MDKCFLCPRNCGVNRDKGELGFCRESGSMRIARYSLHKWEEPVISGERGSGTIFFSGCNLMCEFCQNRTISHDGKGKNITVKELCTVMLELQSMGAENINLVTPTHFSDKIAEALSSIKGKGKGKGKLSIPVVYNSSGYEKVETLKTLEGLVDIYLPDFKYFSDELALKYSSANDYRETATAAISEMLRQVGKYKIDERGIMQNGVIIRHLVLPSHRQDSIAVLDTIASTFSKDEILVSIMSQYTPDFAIAAQTPYKELKRKITTFEYDCVTSHANLLGLDGFCQDRDSAKASYTPNF